ncbi:MAG TPA: ribonuclease HII [Magnetospirillaceae bacterium]|nr:ribonuclease HII [Magnetospirillaceae bacterium]
MGPDFSFEKAIEGIVCGIDEVGRGPLAGPVVAAAVVLPRKLHPTLERHLNDSKKVAPARREELFHILQDCARIGLGRAEVAEIDAINILQATFLAMRRAYKAIGAADHALVDGNRKPSLSCPITCIVKGDSRSFSIAAASIIAKVTRDREMAILAETHPFYGWERNAGYGTAEHLQALQRLGVTVHHRRSFAPIAALLVEPELRLVETVSE